ncbi:hypothetical protein fugu_002456 [Takifugu bimaculatus]|uniref:Uncharacterized protein n=1 Tax=Takifugu bimaculatus TaxID=433685 RepID=A0A4Z2BSI9_9TELE|nr:hypothetical protein fugu_002456 [Takifugu bimaculatus]
MVLVGNKADLEMQRVISGDDAQAFARENRIHYMEASAKNRCNVDEAFLELVKIIRINLISTMGIGQILNTDTSGCSYLTLHKHTQNDKMTTFFTTNFNTL